MRHYTLKEKPGELNGNDICGIMIVTVTKNILCSDVHYLHRFHYLYFTVCDPMQLCR